MLKYKMKIYQIYHLILILLLFFLSSCSNEQTPAGGFKMPPTPVEVTSLKEQNMSDKFEAIGTIEAIEGVTIVSEINASVLNLPFVEGSFIKKGSVIAQLDDSQLSAEVNRTQALYNQRKVAYERVKSIVDQNAGSPQDLDDALANLKVAEANNELAKARLSKTKIVAPFSGTIGTRKVSVGAFLTAGQAITDLANLNEIRVNFSAPEKFLSKLRRNAEVIVTSSTYPDYTGNGKIVAIEPMLDARTRNVDIVAKMQNPEQKFRPGMSVNVSAVLSERPNALTIPNEAVFAKGNQSFVYVLNSDSTVVSKPVTLGLQTPKVVEVLSGLTYGMDVVRAGHQKLYDGAKVMPINSNDNAQKENE